MAGTPIPHKDLGLGIDQFRPENKLQDGFWQDLLNGDPTASGSVKKRTGYQRYAGLVPIRVISITHTGTGIQLTLDPSFVLTDNCQPTPVLVYGRLSASQSGDLTTTIRTKYYTIFTIVSSNVIQVTDLGAVSASYTDTAPQLVVYGIKLAADVLDTTNYPRALWTNHLDTYRSATDSFAVCGMGGNLFAARTDLDSYTGKPTLYPLARAIVTGTPTIGPCFFDTADVPGRTRGHISGDDMSSNWATVTAAAYNAGTGYVDFTLSVPNMTVHGTLSTIINTGADWLTTQQLSSGCDGEFLIRAVVQGTNQLTISCEVPDITDDRYDVSGASGRGGIFTDKIPTTSTGSVHVGDVVFSNTIGADALMEVVTHATNSLYLNNVFLPLALGSGEILFGTRTSQVLCLGDVLSAASYSTVVGGDVLAVTGYDRLVAVRNVNTDTTRTIDIVGDGVFGTATITAGASTDKLNIGDVVRIAKSTHFHGDVTIEQIPTSTQFLFRSTVVATDTSASLIGKTITIDEAIQLSDAGDPSLTPITVPKRWIPIEWPTPATTSVTQTKVRHFGLLPYGQQDFIRSTMCADNMYFTDGTHDVMKFDGSAITRAGLPRWQSAFLVGWLRDSIAKIANTGPAATVSAATAGLLTVGSSEASKFLPGDRVCLSGTSREELMQVTAVGLLTADANTKIQTDSTSGSSGTLYKRMIFKYYARLNQIDANNNITASAQASSQDITIGFGKSAQVQLRFGRFPSFPGVDHARLELEIYRTGGTAGAPPYFKLVTLPLTYDNLDKYVYYVDTVQPSSLIDEAGAAVGSLDPVASVLTGAELGTGWDCPPRAKYISSASKRLLLANIKDYQELDVTIREDPANIPPAYDIYFSNGSKFVFRKGGSSATTTDNTNCMVYELLDQGATAPSYSSVKYRPATTGTSFQLIFGSSVPVSLAAGGWLYLTNTGPDWNQRMTQDLSHQGWWQVASVDSTTQLTVNGKCTAAKASSGVSAASDTLTVTGHGIIIDGTPVFVYNVGGALPTGLTEGTQYYAIVVDANTIKLSTTYLGTAVDITAAGTGTNYLNIGAVASRDIYFATDPRNIPVIQDNAGNNDGDVGYHTLADDLTIWGRAKLQIIRKMSHAINMTQMVVDKTLLPTYEPWMTAHAGNDFSPGQLIVRRPVAATDNLELKLVNIAGMQVFVNGVLRATGTTITARTKVFPSRLCRSYPNYPEIFDNPYTQLDADSDSAIDVNPSDGQEITGVIPFYGDSSFGQSSKEAIVLVFKTASVYVVNIETKEVQKLETNGQGCTYPRSIAATKYGIMFANKSGLYKINRQMELVYLGQIVDRVWTERRNRDADSEVFVATHDALRNKYKLSFPIGTDSGTSEVLVYDHTRESTASGDNPQSSGIGAWTRYDNHPATWWTNSDDGPLFSSTLGRVFSLRDCNDETDYRDDADAVVLRGTYKAMDFGTAASRKLLTAIVASFRVASAMAGTVIRVATELVNSFSDLDAIEVDEVILDDTDDDTNLSDLERGQIRSILFSVPTQKGNYFQFQIENSALDEPVELTQLDFVVSMLTEKGIEQAAQTTTT